MTVRRPFLVIMQISVLILAVSVNHVHANAQIVVQQEGEALGLLDVYEAARLHDARFRSALADQAAGREFEPIASARLRPNIALAASGSNNNARVSTSGGAMQNRDYSSHNATLTLRQPLYDREAWAAFRQGQSRGAASEALFRLREQELVLRVAEAYTQALLAQDDVRLIEAQLQTLDELYRSNEVRFRSGEGTRTEILETGAKRSVLQAKLLEAQDMASNRRVALESLVGMPVVRLLPLAPMPRDVVISAERGLSVWLERMRSDNPELESLRYAATVAEKEIQRLQAGHHPRVDLLVTQGRTQSDTIATFQQKANTWNVGVQLNLPLYAGGGVSAQVRQANAQLDKAKADTQARLAELEVEVHRQHHLVLAGPQRLAALNDAVQANTALVDATVRSMAGGERTNLDILNARERLSQAQRDLLDARYSILLSGLVLQHLAGSLDGDDLREVAGLFGSH